MVMGGTFADYVGEHPDYAKKVKNYGSIYVETSTMCNKLKDQGFTNVYVYPNCREDLIFTDIKTTDSSDFKVVYFSQVSREKGVDSIAEAAKKLNGITIDIYGEVVDDYREEFESSLKSLSNVTYKGVFRGDTKAVYNLLHEYDVMLLPTRWKTEGVPGALVEAKFAALPAIVSDVCYNSEIVRDNKEGIVLSECNGDTIAAAVTRLKENSEYTDELKHGALESARRYLVDEYIDEIIEKVM